MEPEETTNSSSSESTGSGKKSFYKRPLFILVVIAAIVVLGFLAWQNQKLKTSLKDKQKTAAPGQTEDAVAQANKELVLAVSKLIVLPQDEQPTIATVTDLEKLKDQPFFANAQMGDKVLIYTTAKKAVLYRPSENKIIELAPLNIGAASSTPSSTASQKLTVEIRNGSGVSGAGQNFKTKLEAAGNFSVLKVGNAKATYPKTILYISGSNNPPELVSSLKQIAGAEIASSLPAGEPASQAGALLILGQQ